MQVVWLPQSLLVDAIVDDEVEILEADKNLVGLTLEPLKAASHLEALLRAQPRLSARENFEQHFITASTVLARTKENWQMRQGHVNFEAIYCPIDNTWSF